MYVNNFGWRKLYLSPFLLLWVGWRHSSFCTNKSTQPSTHWLVNLMLLSSGTAHACEGSWSKIQQTTVFFTEPYTIGRTEPLVKRHDSIMGLNEHCSCSGWTIWWRWRNFTSHVGVSLSRFAGLWRDNWCFMNCSRGICCYNILTKVSFLASCLFGRSKVANELGFFRYLAVGGEVIW